MPNPARLESALRSNVFSGVWVTIGFSGTEVVGKGDVGTIIPGSLTPQEWLKGGSVAEARGIKEGVDRIGNGDGDEPCTEGIDVGAKIFDGAGPIPVGMQLVKIAILKRMIIRLPENILINKRLFLR